MKLHIRNITDALGDWIEEESIRVGDAVYEGFSPLTDDRCLSSLIYILDPQKPGSFSCVPETCIFFSKESYAAVSSLNRILLNDTIAFSEVIARIEALFRYFNTWAEALHESLIQENGVRALLELSIPVFQNPILLMQIDYSISFLADVPGGKPLASLYGNDIVEGYPISDRLIQVFERSESFLQVMAPDHPFYWEDESCPGKFLSVSTEDMCILLCNCNQDFRQGDGYLLSHLMRAVSQSIRMRNLYPRFSMNDMRQIISTMLSKNSLADRESLQKLAQGIGWEMEGEYYVCFVHLSYHDLIRKTMLYYCHQIESLLNHAKAFAVKEHIVILLNMSRSRLPPEQGLTRLGNYLSDHNLSAGLSTLFTDFYQVQSYLHQAEAALEMGLAQKDREPLYRFKNFALAYLLSNARGNLQIEQLLPDGLKRLIEHDQQFHTTYVTVLRTYLENKCNIADSIRVLCIHRSTFLYQFDKIKEILAMDLNNVDVRIWLLITLRLLRSDADLSI